MSEVTTKPVQQAAYGYETDEVKVSPFVFGLNANCSFLTKFEWIPNGGKDGAEQEALEIVFNINGTEKSMRRFPIVKAYKAQKDGGGEVTDPSAPEMIDAFKDFGSVVTHILHCFVEVDVIKAAMSRPFSGFKEYCQTAASLLPKDFASKKLDVFLQYQWQLGGEAKRTYLDFPKSMKYGKFLCASTGKNWTRVDAPEPFEDSLTRALQYVNLADDKVTVLDTHPFIRNGWFMHSNFAKQQVAEGADTATQAPAAAAAASTGEAAKAAW